MTLSSSNIGPDGFTVPTVRWSALPVCLVILCYFLFLGKFPLQEPDEGRYAEIPREMIERGDFITPTLDYVKYFEKPPLHYWLTASGIFVFGPNEFAVRFWPAFLSLLTVAMVYLTGRRLYGARAGFNSALVLAATPIWILAGRMNTIDPVVSSLISISLMSFILFEHAEQERRRRWWLIAFYGSAGLATLAKGLIGLLFPFGTVVLYVLLTRRSRLLKELKPWLGIPFYLAVTAPWFVLVISRNPEFARFFFIEEHFHRFTSDTHNRAKSLFYFVPVLVLGTLPFVWYVPPALHGTLRRVWRCLGREVGAEFLLLLWFVLIFLFFSLSRSKLGFYILPVFPALALLIGRYLTWKEDHWNRKSVLPVAHRYGLATCAALTVSALIASIAAGDQLSIQIWPYSTSMILGIVLVNGMAFRLARRPTIGPTPFLCLCSAVLTVSVHLGAQEQGSNIKTAYPLTKTIGELAEPRDLVVHLSCYLQTQIFYTGRRPVVVGYRGELSFGIDRAEDRDEWFWNYNRFLREWRSGRRMWVIAKNKSLERKIPATGCTLLEALGDFREVERCGLMTLITNIPDPPPAG